MAEIKRKEYHSVPKEARKEYKALVVVLRVINPKTDEIVIEHTKTIDSNDRRTWLSKTIVWATMNGNYVEVINKEDDDK